MSDEFVHQHLLNDERQRAKEYLRFVVDMEMHDVKASELVEMMRDDELLDAVSALGVCITREQVKTMIEATLAMRALKNDAPVD